MEYPSAVGPSPVDLLEAEGFRIHAIRGIAFLDFPKVDGVMVRINRHSVVLNLLLRLEQTIGASHRTPEWGRHLGVVCMCPKNSEG